MRVLAVTNAYPSAQRPAEGTFLETQVRALRARGVSIDVLYFDRVAEGMRIYSSVRRRIRERLRVAPPDLVHVLYGGILAGMASSSVREIPLVVTFHGSDLQGQPLSRPLRRWIAGLGVRASRSAARRASGVVVVADHLRRRLPAGLDPSRIRTIACGVDLERFRPLDREECLRRLGWSDGRFHVLFAWNNEDPIKRPELARAAVEELGRRGVPVELHVMKGVPYRDVPVWLNAGDVLLLTSEREGSPTVVKEALACNRPVVSVRVGDVEEQLAGVSGCHLANDSASELASGLEGLYAGRVPVTGRQAAARYSCDASAETLERFYRELVGERPGEEMRPGHGREIA